ncbi:MAG: carboxypeptidase regulatory-like domain-containing protein, partial [Williamsia herbipolensis]|nr:carboxypeptidase regulatory-like domain-containing protein [Williamsia herbipolensis]
RRIAVQVRELTPPQSSSITELEFSVPESYDVQLRVDPMAVTAGRQATFTVLVENTGNCRVHGKLAGQDPEEKVEFTFDPPIVTLDPGEHVLAELKAKARRPLTGIPLVRVLELALDDHDENEFFAGRDPDALERAHDKPLEDREILARATFVQKSVMTRGAWSLIGLLLAVTTFAIVITIALSRLVGQTTADRNLALQVAAAQNQTSSTGTSSLSGTVTLLTSKSTQSVPQNGVAVEVFQDSDDTTPVATTATNSHGEYTVPNLAAGKYKISFHAAGFVQLWYPGASTDADATSVTLKSGQQEANLDVRIGGVPATISGSVVGSDVSAATLYLEQPPADGTDTGGTTSQTTTDSSGSAVPPDDGGAVVQTVPIGSDGTFSLTDVPSPSTYDLVVVKSGYATSRQLIDVAAGESRTGVELTLSKGDGEISGTVSSPSGPLSGVTVVATAGQSTASTVSLSGAHAGAFTLRGLPTPASFTVRATKPGFTSQTMTLSLASGQTFGGVGISLAPSSGSLHGLVSVVGNTGSAADTGSEPDPSGVTVAVNDGLQTVQTVTQGSANGGTPGAWQVSGLELPGTYTVTFTRADLATQTVSVSLDAGGNVTGGSDGTVTAGDSIPVTMHSSTATLVGSVAQPLGGTVCDQDTDALGEATVTLQAGDQTYTTTSASLRPDCGVFELQNLPPGTYTLSVGAGSGTNPWSKVVTLTAGDTKSVHVTLHRPAYIAGVVKCCSGGSSSTAAPGVRPDWTVFLYPLDDYPGGSPIAVTTDDRGRFEFDDVDAGQYILATGPTTDAANAVATKQVTVQPSKPRTGIEIVVNQ